ncbi:MULTISPECIES: IucA/IucC family protein [Pseudomonas]|jgi:siderophore synthetase component|uniref:Siderophore synthetase n=1 Tax=Pseudomonas kielensis TaxID=2762577 RepID=A0A7X1GFW0_9PSED|nr:MULTISPECIES: IucA/IucC family protein [Pseudomonas]MBC2691654.1 siderophore synthetase [Pseudomonas kielensis]NBB36205.1 siderophore synthetase [Pseudomonas sp. BC115LW]UZM14317.1 siderophore synthetase [Pseudomonas kielensis]
MRAYTQKQQQLLSRWSEALSTEAFQSHRITLDHLCNALAPAAQRSFQRLIQALFREGLITPDACTFDGNNHCWLTLGDGAQLHFDHLCGTRMNSWDVRGSIVLHTPDRQPHKIQLPSELLEHLSTLLNPPASAQVLERLALELDDSFSNDTLCLAFHHGWTERLREQIGAEYDNNLLAWLHASPGHPNPTSLLEQWGTLGHPWHPNYKTKLGLSAAQVIAFSPEFEASFPIVLCALHRQYAHVEALAGTADYWDWWQGHFPQAAEQLQRHLHQRGLDAADYLPLPSHPWQAHEELPHSFANEIADNLLIITDIVAFTGHPTMSLRTVLPQASRVAPMVKLPVALRLTSVQRTVSPRSARMGPRISQLMLQILDQEPQIQRLLNIVPERIGVHYAAQPVDEDRSRHAGVLYRDNPLTLLQAGELAVPVGSLFAVNEFEQPLLRDWVQLAQGRDDSEAMLAFFDDYLSIAVPALLGIYLMYGVAFEAHQQNSFMVMGADGQLNRLLLRDFGDIRIDRKTLHAQGLDIQLHDPKMTLYDDTGFVRDKLLHTTFMCHLGELTLLCARHWSVPQDILWDRLATQVAQCFDSVRERVEPARWESERQALLEQDWPAKSFMRMRLLDSHADIVGRLGNPLRASADAR